MSTKVHSTVVLGARSYIKDVEVKCTYCNKVSRVVGDSKEARLLTADAMAKYKTSKDIPSLLILPWVEGSLCPACGPRSTSLQDNDISVMLVALENGIVEYKAYLKQDPILYVCAEGEGGYNSAYSPTKKAWIRNMIDLPEYSYKAVQESKKLLDAPYSSPYGEYLRDCLFHTINYIIECHLEKRKAEVCFRYAACLK